MDNILFLIVWGLFIFVLPNIFGKKNKKDKTCKVYKLLKK